MANITRKYALNAKGILDIGQTSVGIEIPDTGEIVALSELLEDFDGRSVKLSVTYDEEYETI